jgi:hypothetical protein
MVLDHLQPRCQGLAGLGVQAHGGAGQVVEQRLHMVVEQTGPMLHARMPPPRADRGIERVFRRRIAEELAVCCPEALDRGLIEKDLAHRAQCQPVQRGAAALRPGVEPADALDLVAEEVEPHRLALPGRKQVQDAAAHGVFAGLHHGAGAVVAVGIKEARDVLDIRPPALAQQQRRALEGRARRHLLHQGVHRGQHDARARWVWWSARRGSRRARPPVPDWARHGRRAGSPRPAGAGSRPRA